MSHTTQNSPRLLARVRRIAGQVAALEKALQAEAECGAVMQQIAAVRGAVNGLMLQVMEEHLGSHALPADGEDRRAELAPVLAVLRSYLR